MMSNMKGTSGRVRLPYNLVDKSIQHTSPLFHRASGVGRFISQLSLRPFPSSQWGASRVSCNLEPLWRVVDFVCHLQTPPPAADVCEATAALCPPHCTEAQGREKQAGELLGRLVYFLSSLWRCAGLVASTTAIDHYHYAASVQGSHAHACWHLFIQEFVILAVTIGWNLLFALISGLLQTWSFRQTYLALQWHCRGQSVRYAWNKSIWMATFWGEKPFHLKLTVLSTCYNNDFKSL